MFKKCAEKLDTKFKYEVQINPKKVPFYFVHGTKAQRSGNGGRGGDNGIGGSSGQIELIKLLNEPFKCKIFHKNGNNSLILILDNDLNHKIFQP